MEFEHNVALNVYRVLACLMTRNLIYCVLLDDRQSTVFGSDNSVAMRERVFLPNRFTTAIFNYRSHTQVGRRTWPGVRITSAGRRRRVSWRRSRQQRGDEQRR